MPNRTPPAAASSRRRILEIGTGDGDGTLALAAALPPDGLLITMESDPARATAARQRFSDAGVSDRVSVIVGEPGRFLHKIRGPFDVIAQNDPDDRDGLHQRLMALLAPGGVLIRGDRKYGQEI
jgi:predicted O-methyltransferase YrrM